MNRALNLFVFISLLVAAVGCGESTSGAAGAGGEGGVGGDAGMGGDPGTGGQGGTGGSFASTCHSSVPTMLSEWNLFDDIRNQVPADGVIPYEVTSPLFTDSALKRRFVALTEGGTLEYSNDTTRWASPIGTIYVKTFAYPPNLADPESDGLEQLVETRLMVHVAAEDDRLGCGGADDCWQVHVYVYNEEGTDAVCQAGGWTTAVTYTNPAEKQCSDDASACDTDEDCAGDGATCDGVQEEVPNYGVPSNGACRRCHGEEERTLGASTGMLNRGNDYLGETVENQIDQLYALGMLAPEPDPVEARITYSDPVALTASCDEESAQWPGCVHEAARSWLDTNCAHCHAPDGEADGTGILLDYASMDPDQPGLDDPETSEAIFTSWGICKLPTSAGNVKNCGDATLDIVPGKPEDSIVLCRIDSVSQGEMMAPLGRTLIDEDGYEIMTQWIEILPELFPDIPLCATDEGT